jgi:hypothetical protein
MITEEDYKKLGVEFNIPTVNIKKVDKVESGGLGFSKETGKIIIQFEPSWFKRKAPYTPSGKWSLNKVEKQTAEWIAFNDAFSKNANAAMESTSIGRMQVMGFHWKLLGFKSVGEMWDYAKVSETNQLRLGLKFIVSNKKMYKALQVGDWDTFAYYYNGSQYKKFNYAERLAKA